MPLLLLWWQDCVKSRPKAENCSLANITRPSADSNPWQEAFYLAWRPGETSPDKHRNEYSVIVCQTWRILLSTWPALRSLVSVYKGGNLPALRGIERSGRLSRTSPQHHRQSCLLHTEISQLLGYSRPVGSQTLACIRYTQGFIINHIQRRKDELNQF